MAPRMKISIWLCVIPKVISKIKKIKLSNPGCNNIDNTCRTSDWNSLEFYI